MYVLIRLSEEPTPVKKLSSRGRARRGDLSQVKLQTFGLSLNDGV